MIIPVYQLNAQGELQEVDLQVHSLAELGRVEPPGVYTVARTYRSDQAVMLDAHLDRLEESARLENIPFQLDRKQLRTGLRNLLARAESEGAGSCCSRQPAPLLAAELCRKLASRCAGRGWSWRPSYTCGQSQAKSMFDCGRERAQERSKGP
jgi:hypothetical protein